MTEKFRLTIKNHEDHYTCKIGSLPIIGTGASPLEAMISLAHCIPQVYSCWANNLTLDHAQDTEALRAYKELTYMLTCSSKGEPSAVFYAPGE